MRYFKLIDFLCAMGLLAGAIPVAAQTADTPKYNHQDVFGPITWPVTSGGTRSASGQPAANYWQNRAD